MAAARALARAPAEERGPAALLPLWAARMLGFAALASLGALEWQRMVAGLSSGRALLWVLVALAAAAGVLAGDRLPGRLRAVATLAAAVAGLLAAYLVADMELGLLKPRRWDELVSGVVGGAQALSTVRLPYAGADPWPRSVLELLGAGLATVSALLAFWPRTAPRRPGAHAGAAPLGYPFLALAGLLILTAAPVVSLGGARSLVLGVALAALTICFLWLERLPLRPGIGVAALLGLALAGALPLASVADRGEPWFDYQSFAEGLGPQDPIRFDWSHGDYGPITWSRDGAEVLRVQASRPSYWKVRTLEDFDGSTWREDTISREGDDPTLDLPVNWRTLVPYEDTLQVSIRRMRGTEVVGAGTTLAVDAATRLIEPGGAPGRWLAPGELRAGDSYRARVFVPRPTPAQLAAVPAVAPGEQEDDLVVRVHLHDASQAELDRIGANDIPRSPRDDSLANTAEIRFPAFGERFVSPVANYTQYDLEGRGENALRLSDVARTWRLAKQLRAQAQTPYEYVLAVNSYLQRGFKYRERPPATRPEVSPLDGFLFDTRAGYCQHFSGAMALLLRIGGVPARVAMGFSPGGFSKRRDAWIVRDTDAHSWVEAWFDGYGWVTIDPTPSATPARSQIAALPAAGEGGAEQDAAGGTAPGTANSAGPANRRAAGEREELFNALRNRERAAPAQPGAGSGGAPAWWLVPPALLAIGLAVVAVLRWRRRPATPLERALLELETALRRSGRAVPSGTTLRQLEQRLGVSSEAAAYLRALSAGRYAAMPVLPTARQRRAFRRDLASGLGAGGRLRAFWAMPPRP